MDETCSMHWKNNTYTVLVRKHGWRGPLGDLGMNKNILKWILTKQGVNLFYMAQDRVLWLALVTSVINIWVPQLSASQERLLLDLVKMLIRFMTQHYHCPDVTKQSAKFHAPMTTVNTNHRYPCYLKCEDGLGLKRSWNWRVGHCHPNQHFYQVSIIMVYSLAVIMIPVCTFWLGYFKLLFQITFQTVFNLKKTCNTLK
jgi:hypothetical protein